MAKVGSTVTETQVGVVVEEKGVVAALRDQNDEKHGNSSEHDHYAHAREDERVAAEPARGGALGHSLCPISGRDVIRHLSDGLEPLRELRWRNPRLDEETDHRAAAATQH
eukprot:CAMPEP_0195583060 /NCGR_PEP_ID=MMETSP0814-20130614/23419_1 /TAXON_ID=97485 /ORGANISM="Prymnesium parvum, Strain Texoma1" /LENGTH=109 /DNA_ID=CAMNT_0040720791 /DNA_START=256 /DNA_END=586 /DNA_ORIENTATION=+